MKVLSISNVYLLTSKSNMQNHVSNNVADKYQNKSSVDMNRFYIT